MCSVTVTSTFLQFFCKGKAFFYKALIDEKSFRKRELKRIINLTFDGDYQAVGEALIAQSLPMEDLEALQERLAAEVEKRKARKAKRSKKKEASEE
jgi:predicted transcriptional regulator